MLDREERLRDKLRRHHAMRMLILGGIGTIAATAVGSAGYLASQDNDHWSIFFIGAGVLVGVSLLIYYVEKENDERSYRDRY